MHVSAGAEESWRHWISLGLELQTIEICLMLVLGTELSSSVSAAHNLHH